MLNLKPKKIFLCVSAPARQNDVKAGRCVSPSIRILKLETCLPLAEKLLSLIPISIDKSRVPSLFSVPRPFLASLLSRPLLRFAAAGRPRPFLHPMPLYLLIQGISADSQCFCCLADVAITGIKGNTNGFFFGSGKAAHRII